MMRLTILLTCLIYCVFCQNCVLDNGSWNLNKERKLHNDLQVNYDVFEPPGNCTTVKVRFILKSFNFDSNEEIFSMYSLIFLIWYDDRLKWEPKDYDGIEETELSIYQIWTPEFKHHTKIAYEDYDQILNTVCEATSYGRVLCMLQVSSQTECVTNLVHWPYDTQNCTFKFGIHKDREEKYVFSFNSSKGISTLGAEYGPGWNIMNYYKGENASSKTQFYLTFTVERQGEILASITIFPSVVVSILTVSSLFLDVGSTRGCIAVLSLIGHIYIQEFINIMIPINGSTVPSVLYFIMTSIVITTISIVLTVVLDSLLRKKYSPQRWVVAITEFVFKSSFKFLIWPRWKTNKIESVSSETKSATEVWIDFANIINSSSIVIVIIIYISIYLSFIPKQIPY